MNKKLFMFVSGIHHTGTCSPPVKKISMRTFLQRLSTTVVLLLLSILTVAAQMIMANGPDKIFTVGNLQYSFYYSDPDHTVRVFGPVGEIQAVDIPETIKVDEVEYKVTSLDDGCFAYCSSLTSITIPESVTSLGNSCFFACTSLTGITIPSSVTSLGGHCFSHCTGLASITIPNSVTSLGDGCFGGCI